jgi:DNA repair protein RecO (recombination protein O)
VLAIGIRKETTSLQISHEVLLECDASSHRCGIMPACAAVASSKDSHNNLPVETTAAILLRKRKFSDTSLIVSWCTESFGCIQTVAKGARRAKSPFAGKLDLFFEAEISIVRSRKSDLHTLTELVLKNPFAGIRSRYLRTQTAGYFVELIEICTERDHREPELFGLLRRAFGYLNENDPTPRAIAYFETELARIAGVHDAKKLKADSAFALGNLFGRLPLSRTPLLKTVEAEARRTSK